MLDDIVTTIDSTHRKRICKLLFEYFNDKQLIITTNDNIWYDQFICYQRAYGMQGKFVNKIISKWNVNHGPSLIGYKPRIENIKDKLDAGDKSGAANEIRQYLEWLLKKVCEFFEVKITYKPYGRNTVADLFEPSKSRISKLGKNQNWGQEMIGKFIDVEADTQTLNALSHDNPEMANISVGELTSLLSAIQNLEKAFQCNSCREFLRYDQTSKFIRCINGKCLVPSAFKTT
jgi:LSD1 subclass zinc finger protein